MATIVLNHYRDESRGVALIITPGPAGTYVLSGKSGGLQIQPRTYASLEDARLALANRAVSHRSIIENILREFSK